MIPGSSKEPEMLIGRRAFKEAQKLIVGATAESPYEKRLFTCSWYGTSIDPERGCFAVVKDTSVLYGGVDVTQGIVGDYVEIRYQNKSVRVYVIGSDSTLDADIALSRRAYLALEILPKRPIDVYVSVVNE